MAFSLWLQKKAVRWETLWFQCQMFYTGSCRATFWQSEMLIWHSVINNADWDYLGSEMFMHFALTSLRAFVKWTPYWFVDIYHKASLFLLTWKLFRTTTGFNHVSLKGTMIHLLSWTVFLILNSFNKNSQRYLYLNNNDLLTFMPVITVQLMYIVLRCTALYILYYLYVIKDS